MISLSESVIVACLSYNYIYRNNLCKKQEYICVISTNKVMKQRH